MRVRIAFAALILVLVSNQFAAAQSSPTAAPFTPEQTRAIEKIMGDYLRTNPEVILQALEALQQKKSNEAVDAARQAVVENKQQLFEDPMSPILGNPKGDVTIVEFLDYRCPHCKKMEPSIRELIKQDGNLRVVQKQFPILGPASVFASRVAYIAKDLGKHSAFHTTMMEKTGEITEQVVVDVAQSVGISGEIIKSKMNSPEITAALKKDFELAQKLALRGTPAFIVGEELIPGATDAGTLLEMVAETRASKK